MPEIKEGTVTIALPDFVAIPPEAGRLSHAQVLRLPKARKGVSPVCTIVADAMRKNPERLRPANVTAEDLDALARETEAVSGMSTDVRAAALRVSQVEIIVNARAHDALRRVLAFVRSEEKFDPRLSGLVPELIEYFSRRASQPPETEAVPSASASV
ncbi:MAG: hypothetical protein PHU25_22390 [Deltaproteobacteria bacterium]|nr:hypothetical protein [Deltaproteobacteria bacterium]